MHDTLRVSEVLVNSYFLSLRIRIDCLKFSDAVFGSIIIDIKAIESEQSTEQWIKQHWQYSE